MTTVANEAERAIYLLDLIFNPPYWITAALALLVLTVFCFLFSRVEKQNVTIAAYLLLAASCFMPFLQSIIVIGFTGVNVFLILTVATRFVKASYPRVTSWLTRPLFQGKRNADNDNS